MEGIINFQYKGKIGVYNYYWQPLSYQLGILLFGLFKNYKILFFICQIFGATSICILTLSVYIYSEGKLNPLLCFSFLIIFPELFFCGLYYNSTVLGMLPMSMSLLFLFWKNYSSNPIRLTYQTRSYFTCLFLLIACCFRIDFFFALPLTIYLLFISEKFNKTPFLRAIILLFSGFVLSLGLDIINFNHILKAIRGHSNNYIEQKWSEKILFSLSNFYSLTNLIIWCFIISFIIYFIVTRIQDRKRNELFGIIPAIFTIAPIYILTTPKYLIPAIMFLLFFLTRITIELKTKISKSKFSWFSSSFIFIAFLLQLVSVQIVNAFPYVEITSKPNYIYSHDGIRLTGAYIQGYYKVKNINPAEIGLAQKIFDSLDKSDKNYVIISSVTSEIFGNAWNWFWLNYYFQINGYQVLDYKNYQEITLKNKNIVILKRLNEEQYNIYSQSNPDYNLLKIPIMNYDEEGYKKMEQLSQQLNSIH